MYVLFIFPLELQLSQIFPRFKLNIKIFRKMALSDAQVSKQIEQMISFIQKESEEKIEEIETKVHRS